MEKYDLFPYYWYIDDDQDEITSIRVYGLDKNNNNICLHIDNFTPFCYLQLPIDIPWNDSSIKLLSNKIDEQMKERKPLNKVLVFKHKLYGANISTDNKKKKFPFLFCKFSTKNDMEVLEKFVNRFSFLVTGLGNVKVKMHEHNADPILQLTSFRKISPTGWITFKGKKIESEDKITLCHEEFNVKYENLYPLEKDNVALPKIMVFDLEVNSTNPSAMPKANKPGDKIFQISCVFGREGSKDYKPYLLTLGKADNAFVGENVIIKTFKTEADLIQGFTNLVNTENPNIIAGYNIMEFDIPYMIDRSQFNLCVSEFQKIGFHKYNIAEKKTIKWSSSAYKNQEFHFLEAEGRLFIDLLPLVKRDYKMDNYRLKTISDFFLGETKDPLSAKGIFKCYRLGMEKDKLNNFTKKAIKAMSVVGKYCVQDSVLVYKLLNKLQTWVGLCEMSKTCCVPIFTLYTQGQQIKVFSQVYKHCMHNNIVVEKDAYITKDNERYVGAHVFPPVPGIYERVVPFDFSSLYPTTIIAYNIDYSTWVTDPKIPDSKCHVMDWSDHISCEHDPKVIRKKTLTTYIDSQEQKIKKLRTERDKAKRGSTKEKLIEEINKMVEELKPYKQERSNITKTLSKNPMCEKRYYRFLKEPKGVIPTILQNLLDARKNTRKQIKNIKCSYEGCKKIAQYGIDNKPVHCDVHKQENETKYINDDKIEDLILTTNVLDKRQLAYKISANSMYGAFGVKKGYLPFMPAAMCTTFMGRTNIEIVAKTVQEKYKGDLVYGDTDCVLATEPVLIKYNNIIDYKTVEELSDGNWTRINPNKEMSKAKSGYQIWSDNGFTNIINVVRCGIKKPLSRVLTHVGVVNCSNEHSLLTDKLESVTPLDIKIGDKLCISELPLPIDTPKKPLYNNKVTKEIIENYIIPNIEYKGLTAELAFVWGLFFADGSCGEYLSGKYVKTVWAINNQDNVLLERVLNILKINEITLNFKIYDTMKSSNVNKLEAVQYSRKKEHSGTLINFVNKYRNLFYDDRKYKKIPTIIFNSPFEIRQSFFMGYYAGDGSRKDPALSLSNKGAIGSAGLFYIMRSIGYQVSINTRNDKQDIYKLTGSTPEKKLRRKPNVVKKIINIKADDNEYIYDIQTENHHFAAGVGQLVVHNSNYIHFPHLKTSEETWKYATMVADEISKLFPPPIKLEFEDVIYWQFFILTKKRYMYKACGEDGKVEDKIGKKGVLLARRDNAVFVRKIYEEIIRKIFNKESKEDIYYYIIQQINILCSNSTNFKDFVITKSVGSTDNMIINQTLDEKGKPAFNIGDYKVKPLPLGIVHDAQYKKLTDKDKLKVNESLKKKNVNTVKEYYEKCLPAQVQLAEKMKRRGQRVDAGTRLEYVIALNNGHLDKQYDKVESFDYFKTHNDVLKIDFMYYLKLLYKPLDEVLYIAFKSDKNFIKSQYDFRFKVRDKLLDELKTLFKTKLKFN